MARSVNRSAGTGRFVSKAAAARWPGKTNHRASRKWHRELPGCEPVRVNRAFRHGHHHEAEPGRDHPAEGLTQSFSGGALTSPATGGSMRYAASPA